MSEVRECASWINHELGQTHCNVLQHAATRCNTLQHAATQHTVTHCNTLQHAATHCNTLRHTATHCNTLQHTATRLLEVCGLRHDHMCCMHCMSHVTHMNETCHIMRHAASSCVCVVLCALKMVYGAHPLKRSRINSSSIPREMTPAMKENPGPLSSCSGYATCGVCLKRERDGERKRENVSILGVGVFVW